MNDRKPIDDSRKMVALTEPAGLRGRWAAAARSAGAAAALAAALMFPAPAPPAGVAAAAEPPQGQAPPTAAAAPAPVYQLAPIELSPERRQLIGLRFATVKQQDLTDR